jgi:hypothetical protein
MSGSMVAANAYNKSLLHTNNKNSKSTTSVYINNIKSGMNALQVRLNALLKNIKSKPNSGAQQGGTHKGRTKHHTKKHGKHHGKRHTKHHAKKHGKSHTRRNNH